MASESVSEGQHQSGAVAREHLCGPCIYSMNKSKGFLYMSGLWCISARVRTLYEVIILRVEEKSKQIPAHTSKHTVTNIPQMASDIFFGDKVKNGFTIRE